MTVAPLVFIALGLPLSARAGTSDPGGAATLIFWGILIGSVVWIALSFFIGLKLTHSLLGGIVFLAGIGLSPFVYMEILSSSAKKSSEVIGAENSQTALAATEYLSARCARDRVHLSIRPVDGQRGVATYVNDELSINLGNVPTPTSPTPSMQEGTKLYGNYYATAVLKAQFKDPIFWTQHLRSDSIASASQFQFAEHIKRVNRNWEDVVAAGPVKWWLGSGLSKVPLAERDAFEVRLRKDERDEHKKHFVSHVVMYSTAEYLLEVRDISTAEDRQNWVARGEMILKDKTKGESYAHYVGFAANRSPAYQTHGYAWESALPCPGVEMNYYRQNRWDAVGFFFREVVKYQ